MTAIDLSKYIIAFFDSKGDLITNKKLQKLLYYSQAWSLAIFGDPIFDEQPQAWKHGPVYVTVYQYFKNFGYNPVAIKVDYALSNMDADTWMASFKESNLNERTGELIDEVLLKYGSKSAFELEILSHRERPWLERREGLDDFDASARVISFESMRDYYSSLRKADS